MRTKGNKCNGLKHTGSVSIHKLLITLKKPKRKQCIGHCKDTETDWIFVSPQN